MCIYLVIYNSGVILANDIDYVNSDDGPDKYVKEIIDYVNISHIHFIYGISRRFLSKKLDIFHKICCIGLLDISNIEKDIIEIENELNIIYPDTIPIQRIENKELNINAKEFIPKCSIIIDKI